MWLERAQGNADLVLQVAENMREWDRREIFATRTNDSTAELVDSVQRCGAVSWVAGRGERPIAAFGCAPLWTGVWSMWLFATDDFPQIGISVTRLVVKSIVPMLMEAGAHRLEARSMEGHTDAQRWLEVIGAQREGTLARFGREAQDFHVYAWPAPQERG